MSINGGNQTPFVTGPADDEDADYSSNGRRIVFTSTRDTDGDAEVFVMSANGANQTQLTFNAVLDDRPVFSPNSRRIAYSQELPGAVRGRLRHERERGRPDQHHQPGRLR